MYLRLSKMTAILAGYEVKKHAWTVENAVAKDAMDTAVDATTRAELEFNSSRVSLPVDLNWEYNEALKASNTATTQFDNIARELAKATLICGATAGRIQALHTEFVAEFKEDHEGRAPVEGDILTSTTFSPRLAKMEAQLRAFEVQRDRWAAAHPPSQAARDAAIAKTENARLNLERSLH